MIISGNSSINKVYYNGYTISKIYACGGGLVWSGGTGPTPPTGTKFSATYDDATTYSVECDGNTRLTTATTKYHYEKMLSAVVGDCVTEIYNNAFECPNGLVSSFSSITISNSVTTLGSYVFHRCSGLTSVTLPDSITSIGSNTFYYCSGLENVNIPINLRSIPINFVRNCTNLTNIDIPSGITTIESYAFGGCRSLTSVTVNATTPPTLGYEAFDDTNNCNIYVPDESVDAYKAAWTSVADRIRPLSELP